MGMTAANIVSHSITNDSDELLIELFVEEKDVFNIYIAKDDMSLADIKCIFGALNSVYNKLNGI
jgi:hypothetical protein